VDRFDVAAFRVDVGDAEALDDLLGLLFRVDADAAVSLLLRIVEITMEAGRIEHFQGKVGRLRLEFLQADDIGVLAGQPLVHTFLGGGSNSVKIQADNAHRAR